MGLTQVLLCTLCELASGPQGQYCHVDCRMPRLCLGRGDSVSTESLWALSTVVTFVHSRLSFSVLLNRNCCCCCCLHLARCLSEYVTMVVTEFGMIPPSSVPVILREFSESAQLD